MAQKYTLSHKNLAKIHCFKRALKGILPHDTLSHNFLINCNTLSHNPYQKRTPCRIIFTVKGHPVERQIPSSQVWEYPPPGMTSFQFRMIILHSMQRRNHCVADLRSRKRFSLTHFCDYFIFQ